MLKRQQYILKAQGFLTLFEFEYVEKGHCVNDPNMKDVYDAYNEDCKAYRRKHPCGLETEGMICICRLLLFRVG